MGRLPTREDFPANVTVAVIPPPGDDPPTNILILLHGLGDKHEPFAKLGQQMNLPETACLAIQGPQGVLDWDGFHWGDDIIFDSTTGGLDSDAGFRQSTAMLKGLLEEDVMKKCGYRARDVVLFGFAQGGMVALNLALDLHQTRERPADAELGGVISVGAGLPGEAPAALVNKCKTPVLVCAGSESLQVNPGAEEKLKHNFDHVQVSRYRRTGDTMPKDRDEMMPIMQFLARRLRSTKGIPKDSVELS